MKDGIENYLSVISENDKSNEIMSDEQRNNAQGQMWALLARRTERYTMGDSSSVSVSIAEELLNSIYYCIELGQKNGTSVGSDADLHTLFTNGLAILDRQMKIAKLLVNQTSSGMLEFENVYYQNALEQVASFFKVYDYRFFAHQNHVEFDYALCQSVEEKRGIQRVNLYLSYFKMENTFCECFAIKNANMLMNAYSNNFFEQYVNIYELIANNAIALAALEKDIFTLDVTQADSTRLMTYLLTLTKEEALEELIDATRKLCEELDINGEASVEYHCRTAEKLHERIQAARDCDFANVFYSLYQDEEETKETTHYLDSESMDDESLCDLIDEISECQDIEGKVEIVNREVRSLSDLVEVLNISFWGDECIPLFKSFSVETIAILLHFLYKKVESRDGWYSDSNWESVLKTYVDQIDETRRQNIFEIAARFNQSSEIKNPLEKLNFEEYNNKRHTSYESRSFHKHDFTPAEREDGSRD